MEQVFRFNGNDRLAELRVREHTGKVIFTALERNPANKTRTRQLYLGQDVSRAWSSVCLIIGERNKPKELEKYFQSE